MIAKMPYPIMSADGKDFYGAVIIIYDKDEFIGYDVLDYTADQAWIKLNT